MKVSTADLALILGVTDRRIQQLENAQVFRRLAHGEWDLRDAVQAFVRYQVESEAAKHTKTRGKAREKLDEAKAEREALKFEVERGALIKVDEAIAVIDDVVGIVRTGFAGLPTRITRDLELREKIEAEIDAVLGRAADKFEKRAQALSPGGPADPAADETAGACVGGKEPDLSG